MSWEATTEVLRHSEARLGDRLVMIALSNYAHPDGTMAFPAIERIAQDARMSRRAVLYSLGALQRRGEIERMGQTKKGTTIWRLRVGAWKKGGAESAPVQNPAGGVQNPAFRGADIAPEPVRNPQGEHGAPNGAVPTASAPSAEVRQVFEAWKASRGTHVTLTPSRADLIKRRLRDFPVADLVDAAQGWRWFAHNRGENDRGTPFNSLELVLRDAAHIERFRDAERGIGRESGPADEASDYAARMLAIHRGEG